MQYIVPKIFKYYFKLKSNPEKSLIRNLRAKNIINY